ncbi:hypothetical protein ACN47E_007779 [Coniothyrium glycines]
MTLLWEESQHTSLTLWDIEREFLNAHKAYEQWQARHRRGRALWACLGLKSQHDALGKALRLGRQVQRLMKTGKELFGARFEQGDSSCHTVLSAQLVRLQYEVRQPLYDSALSPVPTPIPYDEIIATAHSIRRTCLKALQGQYIRFRSPITAPMLPPPRFKVKFCPFADQLQRDLKDTRSSTLRTRKVKPSNRHDDRELCPHCDACISVTAHSGLPDYRSILFTSHVAKDLRSFADEATFACKSCYKTFDDSYAFLDHAFQKQVGSDRSCLRRANANRTMNKASLESDPSLVEQSLKNCLMRELRRVRTQNQMQSKVIITELELHPSKRTQV